jgi:hypothetical protein
MVNTYFIKINARGDNDTLHDVMKCILEDLFNRDGNVAIAGVNDDETKELVKERSCNGLFRYILFQTYLIIEYTYCNEFRRMVKTKELASMFPYVTFEETGEGDDEWYETFN